MFTTYKYRVTVFNDYGQLTSAASDDVTTFGGIPSKPAVVETTVVNHTSIEVQWKTPS